MRALLCMGAWARLALLTQHATRMDHIAICDLWLHQIFRHYLINGMNFEKKSADISTTVLLQYNAVQSGSLCTTFWKKLLRPSSEYRTAGISNTSWRFTTLHVIACTRLTALGTSNLTLILHSEQHYQGCIHTG
jgi:hypothetical protein